jgi:hypothetical protein
MNSGSGKFKSTKFEEIWWPYVGLINIFMGSGFWVTLYVSDGVNW